MNGSKRRQGDTTAGSDKVHFRSLCALVTKRYDDYGRELNKRRVYAEHLRGRVKLRFDTMGGSTKGQQRLCEGENEFLARDEI